MQGETKTYTWKPKPAGSFTRPNGPAGVTGPPDPNIQLVNLKSKWKPFQIVPPEGAGANIYNGENTYFNFECWNHWPVAQIASSGRPCVAADRASHSSLSHLYWRAYAKHGDTETKILMDGLTTKSPSELIPLAKSWISPPPLQTESEGYQNKGYDPAQRAYVLSWEGRGKPGKLKVTLAASQDSPLYDPAIIIRDWGKSGVRFEVDGSVLNQGPILRVGHVRKLSGTDLVIWIQKESATPLKISIAPTG